jgi:hypothetical protein
MSERATQRGDGEVGACHVCGERFDTQEALADHLMQAHGDDLLPTDGTPNGPTTPTVR